MTNSLIGVDYRRVVIPVRYNEHIRVIKPSSVITHDYKETRINLVVGDDDLIQRIYRG